MTGVIRCAGLTKRYRGVTALDGLDLTVEPGQVFGFLGPNGAGKTTTLRILLGLVTPSAGMARQVRNAIFRRDHGQVVARTASFP
jgi:ABC-type multidrug transport system ATPase subunit